ncbi:MAG: hypothetical protein ACYYK0_02015 [Candidatus Eutrophobiaceae bacterium]
MWLSTQAEGDATDDRYSPPCKGDEQGWHDTGETSPTMTHKGISTILGRAGASPKLAVK